MQQIAIDTPGKRFFGGGIEMIADQLVEVGSLASREQGIDGVEAVGGGEELNVVLRQAFASQEKTLGSAET